MSRVEFIYYGIPTGKGRARVSTRGGFPRAYTPKKTKEAEQNLQAQAAQYRPDRLFEGAISINYHIFVPIPKSFSKKKREDALMGKMHPLTKPDIDNIEKLVFDAFNGVIWLDDRQVVEVIKKKSYGQTPCISFIIEEI